MVDIPNPLMKKKEDKLDTGSENTWCPGCPNHIIQDSVKAMINQFVEEKKYQYSDFAICCDIGCNGKMFDYLKLSGVYGLHGRSLPTAMGIKIGNPNLKVLAFAGDGAAYSEGMEHFIHAFKYNSDMVYIVHDNQSFSLTTGQPTPTTQKGYMSKSEPLGVFDKPLNPVAIALTAGATFIARTNARDLKHTVEVLKKAVEHKGFSYVEIMQDCVIFNTEMNHKEGIIYKIEDNMNKDLAKKLVEEYDYNSKQGRLPLGVLYKTVEPTVDEKWPQLKLLKAANVGWVDKDKASWPVKEAKK
jgi:2-oxoglutarate/2-oxoacid ferredoxin oxidoreductase subunit beta